MAQRRTASSCGASVGATGEHPQVRNAAPSLLRLSLPAGLPTPGVLVTTCHECGTVTELRLRCDAIGCEDDALLTSPYCGLHYRQFFNGRTLSPISRNQAEENARRVKRDDFYKLLSNTLLAHWARNLK